MTGGRVWPPEVRRKLFAHNNLNCRTRALAVTPALSFSPVNAVLRALDVTVVTLRTVFLVGATMLGALCAVDWSVRTRRLNPFSRAARLSRAVMSPFIKPVERRVVRAGGNPVSAPWWTLAALVVAGIVVLSLLDFLRGEVGNVVLAFDRGPRGVLHLLVTWMFAAFYLAIIVRVVASWLQMGIGRRVVRWAYALTEPVLAPIRRVIPPLGMVDLSPLVAWLLLSWIIEPLLLRVL